MKGVVLTVVEARHLARGRHKKTCRYVQPGSGGSWPCTCGYTEAHRALRKEIQRATS